MAVGYIRTPTFSGIMPRRGFVLVQTGLNDEEWSRVERILKQLGWSTYRLVKTAILEFVGRHEEDRK